MKLVVLDLDWTLFDPFESLNNRKKEVVKILNFFKSKDIIVCLASLNTGAKYVLYEHGIFHFFDKVLSRKNFFEYETCEELDNAGTHDKTYMLENILREFDVEPSDAILFDDNFTHCVEAMNLGMKFVHVNSITLLTWKDIRMGVDLFKKHKRRSSAHF